MTFSQSVSTCFSKYATFSGRASRSEYWYFYLFNVIIYAVLYAIGGFDPTNMPGWLTGILGIYSVATILPNLAVAVRRLHDTGRGGGWIFITLIPLIGAIWYLVLMLLPSQDTENRFGNVPA